MKRESDLKIGNKLAPFHNNKLEHASDTKFGGKGKFMP
jgi:hypothetical protein